MEKILTDVAVMSAVGTLAGLAIGALVKFLHALVRKTENKLDDRIYDAVVTAIEDTKK